MSSRNSQSDKKKVTFLQKSLHPLLSISKQTKPASLIDLRKNLLDGITIIMLTISLVPLLGGAYLCIQLERWFTLGFYIVSYLLIGGLVLARKKLAFPARAAIAMSFLYVFSLVLLIRFGLPGAGIMLFLVLSLSVTVLSGLRAGVISAIICTISIAIVGHGMSTGWITFDTHVGLNSLNPVSWFQGAAIYVLLSTLMVIGPGLILIRLDESLKDECLHSNALEQSNKALLMEIEIRKEAEVMRDKMEAQLNEAQKMESIGRLAGGVAHDFNNLLTGITGNVILAQMDLSPDDPLFVTLGEVNSAAKRAAKLTRQLLAFGRKQIIMPKVISLNELIENMQMMLGRLIGKDISIKIIPMRRLGRIMADPGQIEQIIVNLSVNARDAMPDGGELTIETTEVTLDENYCKGHPHIIPGDYVMLVFSDNGIGIDKETLKSIFDPFFTTKGEGQGTGLGLSAVYGIVKQHDGHVEVYSEIGKGTTFKIFFPLVREKADSITRTSEMSDLPRGTETALVVEDEAMVRNILTKILTRLGYKVFNADSGPAALAIMEKETLPIDLLITDIIMPHMDGRELAEKAQRQYPTMKVLFTSGYNEDVIAHHGVLDEGLDFIGKPYTPQSLAIKVRKVLDG